MERRPWHKIAEQVEAIVKLLKKAGASE